ncbi:MAG: hypothetical protein KJ634_00070 [Gammaproteobacteria bacterium]|nr:hypothetical protein [Gammaproteobacteria bacterium]MBU1413993.1 hypothetical protein [Gammaproteobacteria bacterium]
MALNWLTVLKHVPWSEVISTAPKVADGAKNLWKTVAGKRAAEEAQLQEAPADATASQASPNAEALAALNARAAALEAATDDLHEQMLASSELIKSLAEQNAQLIARLESQRRSLRWLFVAVLVACVFAAVALLRATA